MLHIAECAILLLLLLFAPALRQQNPDYSSPQAVPGSSPQAQPTPQARDSHSEANSRIKRSVDDLLRGDQVLSGAAVQTAVDDENITLTGTVKNYAQHQRVLALVEQYSRWRRIVDKLSNE